MTRLPPYEDASAGRRRALLVEPEAGPHPGAERVRPLGGGIDAGIETGCSVEADRQFMNPNSVGRAVRYSFVRVKRGSPRRH